ncbi:unnamed protein product [Vicia faba]|uniref:Acid phosphatase/vanadium-dependent haloperoxidase-related protein n=1 Tax=Vicia faba TaxID=3906 RepID=A0AAV1AZH6_VICFA|nr:unnamed protein product [Vicia faba]
MDSSLPLRSSSSSSSFTSISSSSSQPNHTLASFPSALTIKNMLASEMVSNENRQEEFCYLQNGGGLDVAALMENAGAILVSNPTFLSAIFALVLTQSTKLFLNFFDKKQWNFRLMFASQGMPSTRSALCSALTTSVVISHGVAHSLFPVSLGFSLIVMCDAVAVARHVGYQAQVLNALLDELSGGKTPVLEERLKEDLGDTLPQVCTGALLGSTVAVLCCLGFMMLRR